MRHFTRIIAASVLSLGLLSPVFADEAKPFADAKEIDLTLLLAPPPANDSDRTREEIGDLLKIQVTRTKAMEERAQADAEENVWRFADVIGNDKFTPQNLPKFSAFFDRVTATEGAVVDPAKDSWRRPRPHLLYPDLIKPVVKLSKSGSYPSGHATVGTLMGIVLADMLPEKRTEIMARAAEFAHNRLVGGIHYQSDIDAGRISGTVIAATIMPHPDFKTEYDAAKAELRGVLALSN